MKAYQWTTDGMRACLPDRCPLPFTSVESAKFLKKHVALARVRMFDERPGTLKVWQESYGGICSGWCFSWQDLPGGAITWNGTHWERSCNDLHKQEEKAQEDAR